MKQKTLSKYNPCCPHFDKPVPFAVPKRKTLNKQFLNVNLHVIIRTQKNLRYFFHRLVKPPLIN
jgi:hypothetical protein